MNGVGGVLIRLGRAIYVACFVLVVVGIAFFAWPSQVLTKAEIGCADGTVWTLGPDGHLNEKSGRVPEDHTKPTRDPKTWKVERLWDITESGINDSLQACGLCTKRSKGKLFIDCEVSELLKSEGTFWFNKVEHTYTFAVIKSSAKVVGLVAGITLAVLEGLRLIVSYILFGEIGKPFWLRPFAKESGN